MLFWIITVGMTLAVGGLLASRLLRNETPSTQDTVYDLRVYRDQLREIERDVARGVLDKQNAEQTRIEISRRILAIDNQKNTKPSSNPAPKFMALLVFIGLISVTYSLYAGLGPVRGLGAPGYEDLSLNKRIIAAEEQRKNRPTQEEAEAAIDPPSTAPKVPEDYLALVQTLREAVAKRPNDLEGHVLLATHEARLGNYIAAHQAQEKVLRIKGDQSSIDDLTDYAYLLILAANGYVSPQAERAARLALSNDPQNGVARYYLGLMLAQNGRPDQAFRLWDQVLRQGPQNAPWIAPILAEIPQLAQLAGMHRYQIPKIGQGITIKGPSAQDIENAQNMDSNAQMAMIQSMVEGLAERLANEGGAPQDWAQLITSLGVLERFEQAHSVYTNALQVFSSDPNALDLIEQAAEQAGIAQ